MTVIISVEKALWEAVSHHEASIEWYLTDGAIAHRHRHWDQVSTSGYLRDVLGSICRASSQR